MWFFREAFICCAAAAAVKLLGIPMCFSLNRNWRDRFDSSIESGSVMVISPFILLLSRSSSPVPSPSIAKFFSSSQPSAPTPTINICK